MNCPHGNEDNEKTICVYCENGRLLDELDRLRAELKEKNSWMTLGVGDGKGQFFVYGDFESIHVCREKLFELEKLRAELLAAEERGNLKAVELLSEQNYEYNGRTNDLIARHAAQLLAAERKGMMKAISIIEEAVKYAEECDTLNLLTVDDLILSINEELHHRERKANKLGGSDHD